MVHRACEDFESDGKTENAQRVIALDPVKLAALRILVDQLDTERSELGPDYQDHGLLFCWEDGRPPHPDTITRRFKRLAERAGLPLIDLHDVRHSYATAGRDAKIDWKALSQLIGHATSHSRCGSTSSPTLRPTKGASGCPPKASDLVAGAGFEPATSGL